MLALAMATVLAAICWRAWPSYDDAASWIGRLNSAGDTEALALLPLVAPREAGPDVLAAMMASPRSALANEARRLIRQQVEDWIRLPELRRSDRAVALATALARHVADYDGPSRDLATDLALRLLMSPDRNPRSGALGLVEACQRVLDVAEEVSPPSAALPKATTHAALATTLAPLDQPPIVVPTTARHPARDVAPLPPATTPRAPVLAPPVVEPRPLAPEQSAQPLQTPLDNLLEPRPGTTATRTSTTLPAEDITSRATLALFSDLNDADPQTAKAASTELARRGCSARLREVGKHLTSTNAAERRVWVESLPGLAGIDAKPWLLLLSRDEDADVRLAAIKLMATSQDPDMKHRVIEAARTDADGEVRAVAARASELRR